MKIMYGPLKKSYNEDINDLVEDNMALQKGGPGSGKRGHKTSLVDRPVSEGGLKDKDGSRLGHQKPSKMSSKNAENLLDMAHEGVLYDHSKMKDLHPEARKHLHNVMQAKDMGADEETIGEHSDKYLRAVKKYHGV